jgi:hypothetical protein
VLIEGSFMEVGNYTVPYAVQHYVCPSDNRTLYRIVDYRGMTLAEGIEDASLARQFACAPGVTEALSDAWEYVYRDFDTTWDISYADRDLCLLAADTDGKFEKNWPGISGHAQMILGILEMLDYATAC